MTFLSSLTLSQTKDNGAGSLENPNGNFPAPQDFNNLDADYGYSAYHQPYNSTTSFVIDLPFGQGRKYMSDANAFTEAVLGGWMMAGINTIAPGEMVTLTYTPVAAQVVSGIQQDFRGANNYRPNVSGDPLVPEAERNINNWLSRTTVTVPTDKASRSATRRATACAGRAVADRHGAVEAVRHAVEKRIVRVPRRVLQSAQPHELPRAERQPQRRRLRHDHDDRTIRGSFSLGLRPASRLNVR